MHAIRNLARIGFGTVARALVAARLRPHLLDLDRASRRRATCSASRTAPPTSRPRTAAALERARLGRRRRRRAGRLAGGRLLPRRAPDQHDDRDLGPHSRWATRRCSSAGPRATGAPLSGGDGAHRARLRDARQRRPAGHRRSTRTCGSCTPTSTAAHGMLRRGYNFVDGSNALGGLDAGALLHRLRPRPRHPLRPAAAGDVEDRRPCRVPQVHRVGAVRRPAGCRPRRARRSVAVRLTAPRSAPAPLLALGS